MRTKAGGAYVLAAGATANGILAYVFFAVAARALGAEATAPVSVLWAYWSFAGAALTFPLQHWVTRSITALGGEGQVRAGIGRIWLVVVLLSMLAGGVSWLVRTSLFRRDDVWFPLLVGVVTAGSALVGVVRGALAGRHRNQALALTMVAEGGFRCVAAIVVSLAGGSSPVAFGIVLVAGQLVTLAWPSALRFSRGAARSPVGSPIAFLGGTAGGQLLGQAVLTGPPVLLAFAGGAPADITALFAALALFRAPYTVGLGVVPRLTTALTMLVVEGRDDDLRRVWFWIVAVTVGSLGPVSLGAALLGPPVIRLVFGSEVRLGGTDAALLAAGSVLAMAGLLLTIMVMARNLPGAVLKAWSAGVACGAVVFTAAPAGDLRRTVLVFMVTELIGFTGLLVGARTRASREVL